MIFAGRVFKFGDDVDTDVIIPARYLVTTDPKSLAAHCMEDISDSFAGEVKEGDIILGGSNFGCGSSREQAVLAIQGCGVKVILAESFARIFYRNCINRGLYCFEVSREVIESISDGDVISVDTEKGVIERAGDSRIFRFKPLPGRMKEIISAGGIIQYVKTQLNNTREGADRDE